MERCATLPLLDAITYQLRPFRFRVGSKSGNKRIDLNVDDLKLVLRALKASHCVCKKPKKDAMVMKIARNEILVPEI